MTNLKREHLKKQKKNPTKNWTGSPFWCRKRTSISWLFGALFEHWAVLGPNWSPSLPREPPGWSQTIFSMIFDGFWIDFWLIFAFAHLSAITFFSVHWFFQHWQLSYPAPHKSPILCLSQNMHGIWCLSDENIAQLKKYGKHKRYEHPCVSSFSTPTKTLRWWQGVYSCLLTIWATLCEQPITNQTARPNNLFILFLTQFDNVCP